MSYYNTIKSFTAWVGHDERIHIRIAWLRPDGISVSNEWVFDSTKQALEFDSSFHAVVNDALRHSRRPKQE